MIDREEIKKQQIEVGAVADGIPGYETLDKTIKHYKKQYGVEGNVVFRRKGKWRRFEDDNGYWIGCSVCQGWIPKTKYGNDLYSDFCPYCGADLRWHDE